MRQLERRRSKTIPNATYAFVPDAAHLAFLDECRPDGRKVLEEEGETDPLCDDAGGRTRAEIHAELAEATEDSFKSTP